VVGFFSKLDSRFRRLHPSFDNDVNDNDNDVHIDNDRRTYNDNDSRLRSRPYSTARHPNNMPLPSTRWLGVRNPAERVRLGILQSADNDNGRTYNDDDRRRPYNDNDFRSMSVRVSHFLRLGRRRLHDHLLYSRGFTAAARM
jgi:hypothetical protein